MCSRSWILWESWSTFWLACWWGWPNCCCPWGCCCWYACCPYACCWLWPKVKTKEVMTNKTCKEDILRLQLILLTRLRIFLRVQNTLSNTENNTKRIWEMKVVIKSVTNYTDDGQGMMCFSLMCDVALESSQRYMWPPLVDLVLSRATNTCFDVFQTTTTHGFLQSRCFISLCLFHYCSHVSD